MDIIEQYIKTLTDEGKSSSTIKNHRGSIKKFCEWLSNQEGVHRGDGPSADPRLATQLDIKNFKTFEEQRSKPNSLRMTLTHLRAFYRWLASLNEVPDNPVEHIDVVTVAREIPRWLSQQEQNTAMRFIRKYGDLRELTIFTLLLHTGLRAEELTNLKLSDVILSERKGKVIVRKGKWGRYREIPLNVDSRRVLSKYIEECVNNTYALNSEYLFISQRSPKLSTRAIQHLFAKYQQLTGIEHLTAHALRHTFCHELVTRKVPLDVVARLAGHMKNNGMPNIEMTLIYTQPNEDDLARAVEELSWI